MGPLIHQDERRGKRSRQVVFTRPEESTLSPRQLIIAISAVVIITWTILQLSR
jgi:hypothetical protein